MRRPKSADSPSYASAALKRPIVLVGLMGAGKTSIGRLLAARLQLEFIDADAEIESAAHATIEEIFRLHGEAAFRSGERRVIARLLAGPVRIVATGGGAFMDDETRRQIKTSAHSVWLKADLGTLLKRVSRRGGRPLLENQDNNSVMSRLMAERYPVYAKADITVETSDNPPSEVADEVIKALEGHLGVGPLALPKRSRRTRERSNDNKAADETKDTEAAGTSDRTLNRRHPGRNRPTSGGRGKHRRIRSKPPNRG